MRAYTLIALSLFWGACAPQPPAKQRPIVGGSSRSGGADAGSSGYTGADSSTTGSSGSASTGSSTGSDSDSSNGGSSTGNSSGSSTGSSGGSTTGTAAECGADLDCHDASKPVCINGICANHCNLPDNPCPTGCCDTVGGVCVTGDSLLYCGAPNTNGGACAPCGHEQACKNGACGSDCSAGATNCYDGCCDGSTCQAGNSNADCGTGGGACGTCTGATSCNAPDGCSGSNCCTSVCATSGACADPLACCSSGSCTYPGNTTCGVAGADCSTDCATTGVGSQCNTSDGTCFCYSSDDCNDGNCCEHNNFISPAPTGVCAGSAGAGAAMSCTNDPAGSDCVQVPFGYDCGCLADNDCSNSSIGGSCRTDGSEACGCVEDADCTDPDVGTECISDKISPAIGTCGCNDDNGCTDSKFGPVCMFPGVCGCSVPTDCPFGCCDSNNTFKCFAGTTNDDCGESSAGTVCAVCSGTKTCQETIITHPFPNDSWSCK